MTNGVSLFSLASAFAIAFAIAIVASIVASIAASERFVDVPSELTSAGDALVRDGCVIGDYAFSEILRRNPGDPGGRTCVVAGKGFGLLDDAASCRPSPDISGKTPSGDTFSWTNPLTDGTLGAKGVRFSTVPARLVTGESVCLVDFTGLKSSETLPAIDEALKQQAASLTSGSFYSAAVIAGFQDRTAGGAAAAAAAAAAGTENPYQNAAATQQKLAESTRLCDLKLTALRAATAASAACRDGQPCGVSGGIVRRMAATPPSGVRNLCVDATSSNNASLAPCSPSFSSRGQRWTLASTGQLVLSASSNAAVPACLSGGSLDEAVASAPCDPLDPKQIWTVPKKSRDERNPRLGQLVNSASSMCLDSTADDLVLKPCSSTASTQQWTFSPVGSTTTTQTGQGVVGRLTTPQGHCVRAELDPEPWGIDPATGQPHEHHLVASPCTGSDRGSASLFSVNDNGTLESVAFPGKCVAFDAKSWQIGWGVRLAVCDRSEQPADAQRFGTGIVNETTPLSTREGGAGPQACLAAKGAQGQGPIVRIPCGPNAKKTGAGGVTFRSLAKHPQA